MNKPIKVVVFLLSLPLLVLGTAAMFNPMMGLIVDKFSLIPDAANNINGLNSIRGMVGGALLTSATFSLMGLRSKNTTWFLANAALMGIVIFGRLIGLGVDGFDAAIMPALIGEIIIGIVMIVAHQKLSTPETV